MAWTGAGQWSRGNWESYGKTQLGTNVTVQILPTGGNSADQKLLIAVSAGTPPGLFWTGRATVAGWGLRGIAQPLDDRLAKSTVIQNDNFIAHALDENRWKGKVYGLYWSADARILYWNKDLFHAAGLDPEQPPQTWDQFGTVMQRLTKNLSGGDGQVLGFNPTYVSVGTSIWETWFWELGGSYLSADGTHVTIANDAGVGALDWMVKQAQVQGGWNAITSYWSAAGKNAGSATARNATSSATPIRPRRSLRPISRSSNDGRSPVPLTALSEQERTRALERFRVLQPHLEDGALLNRVAQAEAIALRTAERWVQRYRRHGLAGLARQPRTDRGARSVPAELMALIEGLALQTPVLTAAAIHRRLADVTSKHGWAMPSYGTVYAIVRGIEPALVCLAHDGPKVYRERFDVIYRREADGPNAIWQADHTQLDVWVRAERGGSHVERRGGPPLL